ncbi:MAG TPA: Type 1 glutamine amidotransferase-like domain-containing protein [Gemmatimonadaceae bacterium]|nr:Type 1 glutamine amidotransferase-like domain-containing protein [Gemmatimonadaceae bacterium]
MPLPQRMSVAAALAALISLPLPAQTSSRPGSSAPRVGPAHGTVIVVGGGAMGPEIYSRFIAAAGGPDALIVDVPTAGGDSVYGQNAPGTRGWKAAGAKHVVVLHTTDRKLADSDSFAAILKQAGGVWFEGGRQFHLVDSYAGTKTEQGFHDVLARGGVVGGSSAGASILGDFLVRGAPSNNNMIMDSPGYEKGFAFLRGVGIDQHVVARERLADLADSIMPKYPTLLGMSEDEGTAWVVQGDTATIIGRDKAFVYGGKDATDASKPFLTLHPGDRYDLGARHVLHRAASESPVSAEFLGSLIKQHVKSGAQATVLVAENGKVFVDTSFGIPAQAKYMPTTTVPQFALGHLADPIAMICSKLPPPPAGRGGAGRGRGNAPPMTPFQTCVTRQIGGSVGWHKTTADADSTMHSDVDELYRLELWLESLATLDRDPAQAAAAAAAGIDLNAGWQRDAVNGEARYAAYGVEGGKRDAFVRLPDRRASVIILTDDDNADVKAVADAITAKLAAAPR